MQLKTLPIFLAFLLMGVADAMGPLSGAVKEKYQLSTVMATLMPFFVFIAFAIFSVPGGVLAARIGKKKVLLLGLALNTLAVAVPAFANPSYPVLLTCIFLLGVGTTFLQVAGNPIMRDVSAKGDFSRNLALAQGFKGIGSAVSASLLSVITGVAFLAAMGWRGVFPIFFVLMAVALIAVAMMKIDETKATEPPSIVSSLALLGNPTFAMAVLGIFLYVGAEVCMATFLKPALAGFGFDDNASAFLGASLFFGILTFGRLVAGVVKVSPRTFFRLSAFLGLVGLGLLMTNNKYLAVAGVVVGGLGFANIWPMLFSITVEEKPERASELSGLMCMAISGGAIVPLLMAGTLDSYTNRFSPGATITQNVSGATAKVLSWNKATKTIAFTPVTGTFVSTNVITQTTPTEAAARTISLAGWTLNVQGGDFAKDDEILQASSGAKGKVISWDKETQVLLVDLIKDKNIEKGKEQPAFDAMGGIVRSTPSALSATPVAPVFTVVATNGGLAFIVPAACFAYLLLLSLKGGKKKDSTRNA
jgi:fucose permease